MDSPVRYLLRNVDGDVFRFTLPQLLVAVGEVLPESLDAIRMLAPGETLVQGEPEWSVTKTAAVEAPVSAADLLTPRSFTVQPSDAARQLVQPPKSKRRGETRCLYTKTLSDAAIAQCRATARRAP
jgi:hypothetical protein